MDPTVQADIERILARRFDQGADFWTTPDHRLMKGSPYTTLDCACMLSDLGMPATDPVLLAVAALLWEAQREDGRFKVSPSGAIYPCHTIAAARTLCRLGYAQDLRLQKTWDFLLQTQYTDGGWRCNKFSFGHGPETDYSNPGPTLTALDAFRFTPYANRSEALDNVVAFLLQHWTLRMPIGPCHYGIGSRFMQVTYPFSMYSLFYYTYVLSFYRRAREDARFQEALAALQASLKDGKIVVQRQNPGLKTLAFCKQGEVCTTGTKRYQELLRNLAE